MKAIVSREPGPPGSLVLEDIPEPQPGAGEVRIAVKAVGVNYPDVLIIEDRYQLKPPRPFSPGAEFAGVVERVGEGISDLKPGDRVLAMTRFGGMAEKAVARVRSCTVLPDGMPFEDAAAFLMTYGTAHHALADRGRLRAGDTLLVLGAAGGVGLAAVEIGAALGARVLAAVSSDEKLALAREHGAADGLVYPPGPLDKAAQKALADRFKELCGPGGADVVYDPVGGDYAEPALRAIGWRGRFLVIGFAAGITRLPLNLALLKGCDVVGVSWGTFVEREPEEHAASVADLLRLYAGGRVKPAISERFPLERGADAIDALATRKARGKVVVTVP